MLTSKHDLGRSAMELVAILGVDGRSGAGQVVLNGSGHLQLVHSLVNL